MAIVKKIVVGYVVQEFDTETNKFLNQQFIAGDDVSYEDEEGDSVDGFKSYLPYDMVQPMHETSFCDDCGTEETPDEMGNCPNCGKYIK